MKKDHLICRSLRTSRFIRFLTSVLLIISSFTITVSAVFLYSTVTFSSKCRRYLLGTRTLVGFKTSGAAITQEDMDYLSALPGAASVLPEYQLISTTRVWARKRGTCARKSGKRAKPES